jgi:hypothetical protein
VFTIVEQVEEGHVALVRDSWFLLTDDKIEKTTLESHVTDDTKLRTLRVLETAMNYSTVDNDRINFRISENLTIGLSVTDKSKLFINDDQMNEETTLESLFDSPIVPIVNKNFYPILLETAKNIDKFVELDVVKKVSNLINPHLEVFAFNYKNNMFTYRCDERHGNSFFAYSSALEVINEIRNELNLDLTYFYEDKLDKELVVKRKLEDKEREITLKLEEVKFNISKVEGSIKVIGESEILTEALVKLNKRSGSLQEELDSVREVKQSEKVKL